MSHHRNQQFGVTKFVKSQIVTDSSSRVSGLYDYGWESQQRAGLKHFKVWDVAAVQGMASACGGYLLTLLCFIW